MTMMLCFASPLLPYLVGTNGPEIRPASLLGQADFRQEIFHVKGTYEHIVLPIRESHFGATILHNHVKARDIRVKTIWMLQADRHAHIHLRREYE